MWRLVSFSGFLSTCVFCFYLAGGSSVPCSFDIFLVLSGFLFLGVGVVTLVVKL
jgi:hypothetical protein